MIKEMLSIKEVWQRGALAIACAAAIVLAGCTHDASVSADGLAVATYARTSSDGDSALFEGTVENSDGCLVVRDHRAEIAVTPVFPDDSGLPSKLHVGDRVSMGGGESQNPRSFAHVPPECEDSTSFWLVTEAEKN